MNYNLLNFYIMYLVYSLFFIGIIFGFYLFINSNYKPYEYLSSIKVFFKGVFCWQIFVFTKTKEYINIVGIIILEILTTFLFWHLNVIMFLFLLILKSIKIITLLFIAIFRKK